MEIHTSNMNRDISLEGEFQKHLSDPSRKNGVADKGKYVKRACPGQQIYVTRISESFMFQNPVSCVDFLWTAHKIPWGERSCKTLSPCIIP